MKQNMLVYAIVVFMMLCQTSQNLANASWGCIPDGSEFTENLEKSGGLEDLINTEDILNFQDPEFIGDLSDAIINENTVIEENAISDDNSFFEAGEEGLFTGVGGLGIDIALQESLGSFAEFSVEITPTLMGLLLIEGIAGSDSAEMRATIMSFAPTASLITYLTTDHGPLWEKIVVGVLKTGGLIFPPVDAVGTLISTIAAISKLKQIKHQINSLADSVVNTINTLNSEGIYNYYALPPQTPKLNIFLNHFNVRDFTDIFSKNYGRTLSLDLSKHTAVLAAKKVFLGIDAMMDVNTKKAFGLAGLDTCKRVDTNHMAKLAIEDYDLEKSIECVKGPISNLQNVWHELYNQTDLADEWLANYASLYINHIQKKQEIVQHLKTTLNPSTIAAQIPINFFQQQIDDTVRTRLSSDFDVYLAYYADYLLERYLKEYYDQYFQYAIDVMDKFYNSYYTLIAQEFEGKEEQHYVKMLYKNAADRIAELQGVVNGSPRGFNKNQSSLYQSLKSQFISSSVHQGIPPVTGETVYDWNSFYSTLKARNSEATLVNNLVSSLKTNARVDAPLPIGLEDYLQIDIIEYKDSVELLLAAKLLTLPVSYVYGHEMSLNTDPITELIGTLQQGMTEDIKNKVPHRDIFDNFLGNFLGTNNDKGNERNIKAITNVKKNAKIIAKNKNGLFYYGKKELVLSTISHLAEDKATLIKNCKDNDIWSTDLDINNHDTMAQVIDVELACLKPYAAIVMYHGGNDVIKFMSLERVFKNFTSTMIKHAAIQKVVNNHSFLVDLE